MLYFFHHYELPLILRQVQLQNMMIRTPNGPGSGANSSSSSNGGGSSAPASDAANGDGASASASGDGSRGSRETDRNEVLGSEAEGDAQAEFETIERDSDSPPPETLTDDSEMESAPADAQPTRVPSSVGDCPPPALIAANPLIPPEHSPDALNDAAAAQPIPTDL